MTRQWNPLMPPVAVPARDHPPDRFEIRRADKGDQASLLDLIGKLAPQATVRYDWIYQSNPHGAAHSWLAIDRSTGQTVACTSLFPRRVLVQGQLRIGAMGGDTFVEPPARGQGVATALYRLIREEMGTCGIDFNYSAPLPGALAARVRAGSRVVTEVARWLRPLNGQGLPRFLRQLPAGTRLGDLLVGGLNRLARVDTRGLALESIGAFGPEFDRLFEDTAARCRVFGVRDRAYLAWRYLQAPGHAQIPFAIKRGHQVIGFTALEQTGHRAVVLDLYTRADDRELAGALQLILNWARATGCCQVGVDCTPGSTLAQSLWRMGFFKWEGRGFQVTVPDRDVQATTLRDPRAWHFLSGDGDLSTL